MSRFLAAYQEFISKSTDAPPEFGHAGALACLSTVALGRRWIDRGSNGIKPNLYLMLVAESSRDRKSTSVDTALAMLKLVEPDRVGPKDFTAEGLVAHMSRKLPAPANQEITVGGAGQPQRSCLLIPMSEFGQYLSTSQSYGMTTAATLCALYDGQDYDRVRSGAPPLFIGSPKVSLLAGVAFGMLEKYADSRDWSTGFFNRFLFVCPTPKTQRVRFDTEPPFPRAEWDTARAHLVDLATALESDKRAMSISPEALEVYLKLAEVIPANLEDAVEAAQRERLLNAAWKLAMLYQIDMDHTAPIGAAASHAACAFILSSWDAFKRIYQRTATDDLGRLMQRVTEYIDARPEGCSRRELLGHFKVAASRLQPAIDTLVKFERIRSINTEYQNGRHRTLFVGRDD